MSEIFRGKNRMPQTYQMQLAALAISFGALLTVVLCCGAALAVKPFLWMVELAYGIDAKEFWGLLPQIWQVVTAVFVFFVTSSATAFFWIRCLLERL